MTALSLVLDIAEILFYCFGHLNPAWALASICIKTLIWLYFLTSSIVILAQAATTGAGWGILALFLTLSAL